MLKPVNEGSSVGVAIVTDERQLRQSDRRATRRARGRQFEQLLAEPFIRGRELTTAVLGRRRRSLVTELKPESGFYDYDAKYTDGMTDHVCPAEIPDEITAGRAATWRSRAHRLLGCKGTSRAPISAGTTSRASRGCSCSRSTPSRA